MFNGRKRQRVAPPSDLSASDNDQDVQIVDAPEAQPAPAAGAAMPAISDKERHKAAFIEAWDADTKSPEEVLGEYHLLLPRLIRTYTFVQRHSRKAGKHPYTSTSSPQKLSE